MAKRGVIQEEARPEGSQTFVLAASRVKTGQIFSCRIACGQERVERELKLRHVARQLQFPTLAQRTSYRGIQEKGVNGMLGQGDEPVVGKEEIEILLVNRNLSPLTMRLASDQCQIDRESLSEGS